MTTNILQKIEHYGDTHHPYWIDFLRVGLGLILFVKGIDFIRNIEGLQQIIENSRFPWVSFSIAHYVAMAHLAGGLLIALGIITRIAVLFQLPILAGAILFIHSWQGIFMNGSELLFAIVVLLLLIFFLIYGSGPLSFDEWMKHQKEK